MVVSQAVVSVHVTRVIAGVETLFISTCILSFPSVCLDVESQLLVCFEALLLAVATLERGQIFVHC